MAAALRGRVRLLVGPGRRTAMTKAVVLEHVNKIAVRDIDVEEPLTPRDLRIDIRSVGICGSDVHYYQHGSLGPFVVRKPMILGHEGSGVVTEVGAEVQDRFQVGDRVCMEPGVPDPNSRESRLGMYNLCRELRFWATPPAPYATKLRQDPAWNAGHGCMRPSVVHPADFTFKIPDNVSYDVGAMVEPLAVGMHAAQKAQIRAGDRAVVVGAGPIGMMACLAALAAGCSKVFVSDVSTPKLRVAETLAPAGKIVGVLAGDAEQAVKDLTDGWGADIIFECSGNHMAAAAAPQLAAPGGKISFIGCPAHPVPLEVGNMQVKELSTDSSFRYAHVYPKAVALLESGAIDLDPIITNTFGFDEAAEAFDFMCRPPDDTIKSVIRISED